MNGIGLTAALIASAAASASAPSLRTVNVPTVDYPSDVVPDGRPLFALVDYEIAGDGRVTRCTVEQSSGRPSIDAASCRILLERARIRPQSGAIRGKLRFRWLGDASEPPPQAGGALAFAFEEVLSTGDYPREAERRRESGTVTYEVQVSENGIPQGCSVIGSSGSESLDRFTCEVAMTRGVFIAASDGAGGRRAGIYRSRLRWRR